MKVLALLALSALALAATDDIAGAAVDQHQTVNEKVITNVHGPVSCAEDQRLACDKRLEHRKSGETVVTRTCMCIRIPKHVCTGGRKYTACGSPTECQPTCQNHAPCGDAINACVPGCQCPDGMADTGVACLPMDQCAAHGSGTGKTTDDFWEIFHAEANGGKVEYEFETSSMSVSEAKTWCMSQETCVGFVYDQGGKVEMLSSIKPKAWSAMGTPSKMRLQGTYIKPLCTTPMHPSHGGYIVSGGGVGARALFHCDRGYKLVGSAERVCRADKSWSGQVTFCEEDRCSVPPTAEGATVLVKDDVATYTCEMGRSAVTDGVQGAWWAMDTSGSVKSVSIKCKDNKWPVRPECVIDCGPPEVNAHAELKQSVEVKLANGETRARPPKTTVGGIAKFRCKEGAFKHAGSEVRKCGADGKWSGEPLQCEQQGCGKPMDIAHGEYATNGRTMYGESVQKWAVGRIAQYNCDQGFQMLGAAISTCQENGHWTPAPVCTKIKVCKQTKCSVVRGSDKLLVTNDAKADWHKKGGKKCPKADVPLHGLECREAWQSRCDASHPLKQPHFYAPGPCTSANAVSGAASTLTNGGCYPTTPIETCHFISVKHKTYKSSLDAPEHGGEEYGNRHRCSVQHPCTSEGCCECLCWWDENEQKKPLIDHGYSPHPSKMPLEHCEGDCDKDSHCAEGFMCHHNDGKDAIPGCEGVAKEGMDYCVSKSLL